MSIINLFPFKLPDEVSLAPAIFGKPSESVSITADCAILTNDEKGFP